MEHDDVDTNMNMDMDKDEYCSSGLEKIVGEDCKKNNSGSISLPPFGLATYKMQSDLWLNTDLNDYEKTSHLCSAADSWLKQFNVHHHDFDFSHRALSCEWVCTSLPDCRLI